jgi:hypothetical protein
VTEDPPPIPLTRVCMTAGARQVEVESPLSLSEVTKTVLKLFAATDVPGLERAGGSVGFLHTERVEVGVQHPDGYG